jgi:hypothetical protein
MVTNDNNLHAQFIAGVEHIRDTLGKADIGRFRFCIEASGRTQTNREDVLIEYTVSTDYGTQVVKGNALDDCLVELLRRHGWSQAHAPLALAGPSEAEAA